ncbi:MAG: MAPEG family protein, partial [Tabrizicola sp.]
MNNHFEGLTLFTLAVVVVTLGNQSTQVTQTAAWAYLGARILYIPAYALGWRPWRSVIWSVGFFATLTMIAASLL